MPMYSMVDGYKHFKGTCHFDF